jgi:aryl sulfotransferase
MPSASIEWPKKTREFHNHHFNSTVWNDFKYRDDDVVVATWGKAGTTWMQQIVGQLIFEGAEGVDVANLSPWVEVRVIPKEEMLAGCEAMTNRRFLKTHLYVDALVFSPKAKYIYIGRDGRDVVMSQYSHHANANQLWYDLMNDTPGRVGPPLERPTSDVRQYFNDWLDRDGYPFWPFWSHVQGWWDIRHLPNVLFVHFANLKADMPGEIARIADFLDIDVSEETWPKILEHCSFDYMKSHAAESAPAGGAVFEGGAQKFFKAGKNGRWRDVLTAEDIAKYEAAAAENLTPECAHWLATGELPD